MKKTFVLCRNELYKIVCNKITWLASALLVVLVLYGHFSYRDTERPIRGTTPSASASAKVVERVQDNLRQEQKLLTRDLPNPEELDADSILDLYTKDAMAERYKAYAAAHPLEAGFAYVPDLLRDMISIELLTPGETPLALSGVTFPDSQTWLQGLTKEQRQHLLEQYRLPVQDQHLKSLQEKLKAALEAGDYSLYLQTQETRWSLLQEEVQGLDQQASNQYQARIEAVRFAQQQLKEGKLSLYDDKAIKEIEKLWLNKQELEEVLKTGISHEEVPHRLTDFERSQLQRQKDEIAFRLAHGVTAYQDNNLAPDIHKTAANKAWQTSYMILGVYLAIIAGSLFSQEVESGSIKLLIIAPVRRYRIFLAKYGALFLTAGIGSALVFFLNVLGQQLFHPGAALGALLNIGGRVYGIPFWGQMLWLSLSYFLRLFFYSSFAFMLSCLIRKSAISVAVGCMVTFLDLLGMLASSFGLWMKSYFIMPFVHLSFFERFYPSLQESLFFSSQVGANNPVHRLPLGFNLLYVLGFLVLFMGTSWLSITKRDL